MKKIVLLTVMAIAMMLWGIADASAYSVSITKTYNHSYGDSHDVPYFTSDFYDFSGDNFTNIDSFDLSLTFRGTNDQNFFWNSEHWRVRLENDGNINYWTEIHGTNLDLDMTSGSTDTTQTFTIDSAVDGVIASETPFAAMVAAQQFKLWFAEESMNWHGLGTTDNDQFHLVSATVTANGSTVPIPGALWLLGSGLFGLVAIRRK